MNSKTEEIINRQQDRPSSILERFEMDTIQRRENSAKKLYESVEMEKPSFHPKILRGPKNSPLRGKEPVAERLYKLRVSSADKERRSRLANQRRVNKSLEKPEGGSSSEKRLGHSNSGTKISAKSEALYEELVVNKLKEIFSKLDANEDGIISALNIDISGLSSFQLEKFAPLLVDMEDQNQPLDQLDFVRYGKILLSVSFSFGIMRFLGRI